MDESTLPWASSVIQLSTAAGFAGLTWFLLIKRLPSLEERHLCERKEWLAKIEEMEDALQHEAMKLRYQMNSLEEAIKELKRD